MEPTWIEVAINGPWGRADQPGVPLAIKECIEEGIACVEAGAAIVHVHAFDPETDEQTDDPAAYAEIIDGITSEVDAIVYPTIPLAGESGTGMMPGEDRFAHQAVLADQDRLEWAVVDPGSVNFSTYTGIAQDDPGFVYQNPEEHVRTGLKIASRHGTHPSYAIYEPGFIRAGAALADRFPGIGQPIYRFMFSDEFTFSYPPEEYALDSYLRLLDAETPEAPWMVAGLKVDITPLIEPTVDRGGHIRVGLEDAPHGSDKSNREWVDHARRKIEAAGGTPASAADVRHALND